MIGNVIEDSVDDAGYLTVENLVVWGVASGVTMIDVAGSAVTHFMTFTSSDDYIIIGNQD